MRLVLVILQEEAMLDSVRTSGIQTNNTNGNNVAYLKNIDTVNRLPTSHSSTHRTHPKTL